MLLDELDEVPETVLNRRVVDELIGETLALELLEELMGLEDRFLDESVVDLDTGPAPKLEVADEVIKMLVVPEPVLVVVDEVVKALIVSEPVLEVDPKMGPLEKLELLDELVAGPLGTIVEVDVEPEVSALVKLELEGLDVDIGLRPVEELELKIEVEVDLGRGPPKRLDVLTIVTDTPLAIDDPELPLDKLLVTQLAVEAEEELPGELLVDDDCGRLELEEPKELLVPLVPEELYVLELVMYELLVGPLVEPKLELGNTLEVSDPIAE
ncbi:uncharacterized protein A1O5_08395 [Cladophialophora psammophila CBS 110553]|uniref:Uncharacterized protein n=1 Tax=Cladophialophora psammophila CBS 110553 TaxID=1182543 RepID=W9WVB8_9EURO|nr:uncharacterized protein A1O5_08395 [Cladophialophora psammophila CBS 110553]EXJ68601.1 hypothetical protein A1O5_08395 [Cladophialophora psammophila CBS 110553]